MTRAEITRRKELGELAARVLCKIRGCDPDARSFAYFGGRWRGKPYWICLRPQARRWLAEMDWEPASLDPATLEAEIRLTCGLSDG